MQLAVVRFKSPVAYAAALNLQRVAAQQRAAGQLPNTLIMLEHPPTFTAGRRLRGGPQAEKERLEALGAAFHEVPRGGEMTFHGPGQLVAYPILRLREIPNWQTPRCYVDGLQQALVDLLHNKYGIPAETGEHTGVWVGRNKIAALGIHIQHGVTTHGLALNCSTDLSWYGHFIACGLRDRGATSISQELGQTVAPLDVASHIASALASAAGLDATALSEEDFMRQLRL